MKHQLVGFNQYGFTNKDTGEHTEVLQLHFVRKPDLTESGAQGNLCVICPVYDEAIGKLPEIKVGSTYDCDISSYKGFNKLRSISLI